MLAKWLLCNVGPPDQINSVVYAIQECGREVEVLKLADTYRLTEKPSDERACIIFRGSINMSVALKEAFPNWIGNWHSTKTYHCTHYYSFWGPSITQRRYVMMTIGEVVRNWDWLFDTLGRENKVFIRPNSGEKEFNGEVIERQNLEAWKLLNVETRPVLLDELCVVATPVKIQKEMRLVIADKKVVTGSVYRMAGYIHNEPLEDQHDADAVINFAENVLAGIGPPDLPPVHVLDIAVDEYGMSVMEVGCFCCCGLYACDVKKIVKAVSETAERL